MPRLHLPLAAAGDLLGVARPLWRNAKPFSKAREDLEQAGVELKTAIDLAKRRRPAPKTMTKAWMPAERTTSRIGAVAFDAEKGVVQEACAAVVEPSVGRVKVKRDRWHH